MLEVIKRAAVGDVRYHCAQLQGRHRNSLAVRAHLAHPAELLGNRFIGIGSRLLARDIVARQFAQAILMSVISDLIETQLAAKRFEICVVRSEEHTSELQS